MEYNFCWENEASFRPTGIIKTVKVPLPLSGLGYARAESYHWFQKFGATVLFVLHCDVDLIYFKRVDFTLGSEYNLIIVTAVLIQNH